MTQIAKTNVRQTERKTEGVTLYVKATRQTPIRDTRKSPQVSEWLACHAECVDPKRFGWSIDPRTETVRLGLA
jgi:hypothetical protein